jgi:Protein of unknown function (DUF1566)
MLLNVPGRFRVMICAVAVLGAAGCSSGGGGGSGGATASGGAAGHSSAGSMGSGGTGGTASGGVAGAASGGAAGIGSGATGGTAGIGSGAGGTAGAGGGVAGAAGGGAGGIGGGPTGGTTGTGGATGACQGTETQCSANGLQTCSNGQWGAAVACATRQTCTGAVGVAKCSCNTDPVCGAVGSACDTPSKLAACSQDAQGCFYEASSSPCTNGACSGVAGLAACCANACTTVGTQCGSSTSLQTCSVAANGCTALATSTCSSGLLCERIAPADCVDPTWAEWPMPNGPVDVAAGAPNPEAYTDNGDGTITDNVTELMWQKAVPKGTYTWTQAVAYCPTLTLGGHSDWRLPSRIELVSIVDIGLSNPSINRTYFPATPASYFWSSSLSSNPTLPSSPSSAWVVHFGSGGTNSTIAVPLTNDVRCVR